MARQSPFAFEELERVNDQPAILRAVESAHADGSLTGWQALAGGRAGLRSGAYDKAQRWLAVASAAGDPAVTAIATLDQVHWSIAAKLDMKPAKSLLQGNADPGTAASLSPAMRAEVDWLRNRLIAALRIYKEVSSERAENALVACLDAAGRLEASGLMRRALAARVHVAERREALDRDSTLEELAAKADAAGEPDFSATCHRMAAYAALNEGRGAAAARFTRLAESAYQRSGDVFGALDIEALQHTAALFLDAGPFEPLEACVETFFDRENFTSAMSCLLALSSASLRRGDTARSKRHRARLIEIAGGVGAPSLLVQDSLAKADFAMRANHYSEAISHLADLLDMELPDILRAGSLAQRSVAMSQLGRRQSAEADLEQALALYEAVGSEADASDLIAKHALDRVEEGTQEAFLAADRLLIDSHAKDRARGDPLRSVAKLEGRVDIRMNRMLALQRQGEDIAPMLGESRQLIEQARQTLASEPQDRTEIKALFASLQQREGTCSNFGGDTQGLIDASTRAATLYQEIGYGFQAANCYYILGCLFFNEFNSGQADKAAKIFGLAERCLQTALGYYRNEGSMQALAARAAEKLAGLYLAAHRYLAGENRAAILAEAERLIRRALDDMDEVRRAYSATDRLDALQGKAAHSPEGDALFDLGLRLSFLAGPDAVQALHFVSRRKSRILADLMGVDLAVPRTLREALERNPTLAALLRDERATVEALAIAKGDAIGKARARLATLYDEMAKTAIARPYVEVRRGEAPDANDLPAILDEPDTPAVFVDWVDVAGRVWLLASRANGTVEPMPTTLAMETVRNFRNSNFTRSGFRLALHEMPGMLTLLDPLVGPLASLTAPGDHLILCPTGPIGAVPLHALTVDGGALIDRNPVFYAPSLGILRTCRLLDSTVPAGGMSLFGVLDQAHTASEEMIARLSAATGKTPMLGAAVTETAIVTALASMQAIHFQGHGEHHAVHPLKSCLKLPEGAGLTAERIFGLRTVSARLVVLGACEGAVSRVESGDELLGLIPALLAAGVSTVIAAGWRVMEPTAVHFMEVFYDAVRSRKKRPIEAVREAARDLRRGKKTATPYHWAAFVGHGDPWRRLSL